MYSGLERNFSISLFISGLKIRYWVFDGWVSYWVFVVLGKVCSILGNMCTLLGNLEQINTFDSGTNQRTIGW